MGLWRVCLRLVSDKKNEYMDINNVNVKRHLSDRGQFSVPEGYFDSLTKRVMERVDDVEAVKAVEDKKPARRVSLFSKYAICAVAACVVGLVLFVFPLDKGADDADIMDELQVAVYDEDFSREVMNYAMLDYEDVYAYLAGPNY